MASDLLNESAMSYDRFGRHIHYLRISLTDVCNLRCVYCMPEDMKFRTAELLLNDGELIRLAGVFASLGFTKFRLTGGEPTLRENIVGLVREMAVMPGVQTVALTTNGVKLKPIARALAVAGLERVNVSLDTLNPQRFNRITRWGNVADVLAGIAAAEQAGIAVKINSVVVRNFNDRDDAVELARLTMEKDWQVRFIEMMPFGSVAGFQQANAVSEDELRAAISSVFGPLELLNNGELDGEARLFKIAGAKGTLGFISPLSKPFCAGCNRARLTADGTLRLCLLRDGELDLRTPMRAGKTDAQLIAMIEEAIWHKQWGHGLAVNVRPMNREMSEIGG